MNFFSTVKLVISNLRAQKGRSLLTILGIVIGIAGVIIIISLGAGAQSFIVGQVTKLGSNILSVQPGKSNEKGPPAQIFGIVVTSLINDDARALRSGALSHAVAVNANVRGTATVIWGNRIIDTNLAGSDSYYPQVLSIDLKQGRFFNRQENGANANVVVLGSTVADELFSNTGINPIGQVIKVKNSGNQNAGGVPLRIIGVISPRGSAFFQDQDDQIFLPLEIAQKQILGIRYLQAINIKVDSKNNINSTIREIKTKMNQRHHIKTVAEEDYTVRNIANAISMLSTITNALRLFLTAMAAISLVVGGIGILNIMMVTVNERTREIGLRKAIGAINRNIRNQFLLEATFLTALGGMIGILIGVIISYLIFLLMQNLGYHEWSFLVSFNSIMLASGMSILTGLVFGVYPAMKAAKLNPIEALRYE